MANPKIPHQFKEIDKQRCQTLYWNLLHPKINDQILPSHFIRELEQTRRCDSIAKDLSVLRDDYKTHFNRKIGDSDAYKKLIEKNNGYEDVAAQTIRHNLDKTEKCLISALNWKNKLYYYTIYNVENTLSILGISTTLYCRGLRKLVDDYKK